MRLIYTTDDQLKANQISNFLKQQTIQSQLEVVENKDWGSNDYGTVTCFIWVIDEEQFERAQELINDFNANPNDAKFRVPPAEEQPVMNSDIDQTATSVKPLEPLGRITRLILLLCTFLFISGALSEPDIKTAPPAYLPISSLYQPPVNKALMYDYPEAFDIADKLIAMYGLEALKTPETLPDLGRQLIKKLEVTPYWQGFYPKLVDYVRGNKVSWNNNVPMFEKIKQGEVWRLFTPCLLHSDIFHIFFNMIWLIVLGKQMEARIGSKRFFLFVVIAAIISNTAQYLMSGSNFLGFSGVLVAMLAFIWVRLKKAGWEGYKLERGTLGFILFFILFMFALQVLSFILEAKTSTLLPIGIANTAHLVGGATGALLARLNFFSWRHS